MSTQKIGKGENCPLYQRGEKLLSHGDLEGARDSLLESVSEDPCNAPAWALLSQVYDESGEPEHAAEAARQAVRSDPQNPQWHVLRGVKVMMAEEPDDETARAEVMDALDTAVKLAPKLASAHLYRGVALARIGDSAQAISSVARAVGLEPGIYDLLEDIEEVWALRMEPGFPAEPKRPDGQAGNNPFKGFQLP